MIIHDRQTRDNNRKRRPALRPTAAFGFLLAAILAFTALFPALTACAAPPEKSGDRRCTVVIECTKILENIADLDPDKLEVLPADGIILAETEAGFSDGESVYDLLVRVTRANGIHMEAAYTPVYDSAYIEGIGNLYEFDCGEGSGWTYSVNGVFPNYGCSKYLLSDGDRVEWHYTCDFGRDVGADGMQ